MKTRKIAICFIAKVASTVVVPKEAPELVSNRSPNETGLLLEWNQS